MLSWKNVVFAYSTRTVFRDVSLQLGNDARIVAVMGASGIGKSTFLGILSGHLMPVSGEVWCCGERPMAPDPSRPVVFQEHNLFPWMSVFDNVAFGLSCRGWPKSRQALLVNEMLEKMGLRDVSLALPRTLSAGMKQRVGLARALVTSPKCILMDEPFASIDQPRRRELSRLLSELVAERGTRVVLSTHNAEDAGFLADQVLLIEGPGTIRVQSFAMAGHPRPSDFWGSGEYERRRDRILRLAEAMPA